MKAGQLNQWATLERRAPGQDDYGQPIDAWTPLFTTFAAVEPLTGREYIAAAAMQSEVSLRIRLRFRPGVDLTSADRVRHDGKIYNIVSVIDRRAAHREIELMCRG